MNARTGGGPNPNAEEELREALRSRAAGGDHMPPFSQIEHRAARKRQTRLAAAGVAAAVVVIGAALLVTRPDGGNSDNVATRPDTTIADEAPTTTAPDVTTTTEAPPTTTTTAPAAAQEPPPGTAVWTGPVDSSPEDAVMDFAQRFLGMTNPVVGEFQQGDSRSGEVEIRTSTRRGAPETNVLLRQIVNRRWSVIATVARDIRVAEPSPGHVDGTSPVHVSGEGRAFEGTINVEVRTEEEVLGTGFVTAGCCEDYEPFSGDIEYRKPQQRISASVVFVIHSAEDGSVVQASAVPIQVG